VEVCSLTYGRGKDASSEMRAMRTYIYYSDDKIRELAQQLPSPWWRRALRRIRGGEIDVLGVGAGIDIAPEPDLMIRDMQRVWRHLDSRGQVGTFDEPRQYFHGQLAFSYGIFDVVKPPVFFLIGDTKQTIVALGGQQRHVRGFRDQLPGATSEAPSLVMESEVARALFKSFASGSSLSSTETPTTILDDDLWAKDVALMYYNREAWQGARIEFEVLARREKLTRISLPFLDKPRDVLVGSPVFVAQM
jgi:hypothetical protein